MSLSHTYETLEDDIKNLQLNFTQILTSGCHYNTQEIINHIKHINNALDNIKLDHECQRGSKSWAKQFDPNEMKQNETNIKQIILKGNDLARQLNNCLHNNDIKNKELNQIREVHNWACDSLLEYLRSLHPYASGAYARLDNMAHHLGVTDRYIGYRNNLSRYGNQPINVNTIWADRKLPPASTPDWKEWTNAFQHNSPLGATVQPSSYDSSLGSNQKLLGYMSPTQSTEIQHPSTIKRSESRSYVYANDHNTHMSKAGMNIYFPGETETGDRFIKASESSYSPSLAVAQPDYTSIGRPLAGLMSEVKTSEYTHSFIFPDASKVERYPWLRP